MSYDAIQDWSYSTHSLSSRSSICSSEGSYVSCAEELQQIHQHIVFPRAQSSDSFEHVLGANTKSLIPDTETFAIPQFLDELMKDLSEMDRRKQSLSEKALYVSLENTLEVLTFDCLSRRFRLQSTINELESIISGSFDDDGISSKEEERSETENSIMKTDPDLFKSTFAVSNIFTRIQVFNPKAWRAKTVIAWTRKLRDEIIMSQTWSELAGKGTQQNIETVLLALRSFSDYETVKSDCCYILRRLSIEFGSNSIVAQNMVQMGCLNVLHDIYITDFHEKDQNMQLFTDIIWVFFYISGTRNTAIELQDDKFIGMFLMDFGSQNISKLSISCAGILVNMIVLQGNSWNLSFGCDVLETLLEEGISRWPVGISLAISFTSFAFHLKQLLIGSPAVQYYCAWVLANQTTVNSELDCRLIRRQHGVSKMKTAMISPVCSNKVKKLVNIALSNIEKRKSNRKTVKRESVELEFLVSEER